jgi:hypothetical protein
VTSRRVQIGAAHGASTRRGYDQGIDQPSLNPALKELEFFTGEWDMELSNAAFLASPEEKVHGSVTFRWVESGALLVMSQGAGMMPAATWAIGRDDAKNDYTVLYADNRGVSRVYEMSFARGVWEMWRNNPEFSQRFEGRVSEDKRTIEATWAKSSDGKTWEHDFDLRYTKRP